jgi:hypothetical protein
MPGMRFYWRQRKSYFQPEFIEWVESLLAQDPVLDMDVYRNESSIQAE